MDGQMKKHAVILTIAVVLLSSCRDNENAIIREVKVGGRVLTEINTDNIPSAVVRMNMSDIFTDFSIIPLETKDESLIGAYNKRVKITDNNVFLGFHGMGKPAILLRFDRDGNYLNKIGTGGRGPGEHGGSDVYAIIPDEENRIVTVEWFGLVNEGPMTYTYEGTWIESIRQPMILLYGFHKWGEDEWFSCGSASGNIQYERDSLIVVFYNHKGEVTGRIPRKVYPYPPSNGYTPGTSINIYRSGDNYKVYTPESDTVYLLTREALVAACIVLRGKDAMPYNKYIDPVSVPGKHNLRIIAETGNNYILTKSVTTKADIREYMPGVWGGAFQADNYLIVTDKKRRTGAVIEFFDDVFGIIPEKANYEQALLNRVENGRISYPIDAITFLKMAGEAGVELKDLAKFSTSPERLLALTPDSNPVILTFTLKDHIRIE